MNSLANILILGLGNTLLSDDGVGIYVAREIGRKIQAEHIQIEEASLGGLEILDLLTGYDRAVLIDAIVTGAHPPGTVLTFRPEEIQGEGAMSRHQVPLTHALGLGRKLRMDLPGSIIIYGIEVTDIQTLQEACTDMLAKQIPAIADEIIRLEDLSTPNEKKSADC